MSGAATTYRTARFLTADYLVRGQDNPISCPLWASGALVAPTQAGSTVTIYDASNTVIVSAAAVTVSASIATYTVLAASVPTTRELRMGWRVEWSLVVSGVATVYRNNAGLVRSSLSPMVTDADLYRRRSALDPSSSAPISSLTTYQTFIDGAWITIHSRLTQKGSMPHLVMEPSALYEVLVLLSLARIYDDFKTRLNESYAQEAKDLLAEYRATFNELAFEYDTSDSGQSDGRKKRAAVPSLWMM